MKSANYNKKTTEDKRKAENWRAKNSSIPSPITVKLTKKDLDAITSEEIGEYTNSDTLDGKRKAAAWKKKMFGI